MLLPARKTVLFGSAVAVVVLVVLGVLFAGQHGPTTFDEWASDGIQRHLGYPALRVLQVPTNPVLMCAVLAVVAIVALTLHRAELALLAVAGPGLSVVLASFVLKPIFGRRFHGGYLAYPSGHTTAITATLLVVVIAVALVGKPLLTTVTALLAVLVLGAAMTSLVGLGYHYVTDTFGGICVAGATVALVACVLDSAQAWRTHRDQGRRRVHSMQ